MKLTQKQQILKDRQDLEGHELYMYENPNGKIVFMEKRRGVADIYTTLAIRSLMGLHILQPDVGDKIDVTLACGYSVEATRVWIN